MDETNIQGTENEEADDDVMGEVIGKVFKYFSKVGVAAINITSGTVKVGDTIRFKGMTTDFTQQIDSMEIDRQRVDSAGAGQSIGIKVKDRVRENDTVYKM